MFTGVVKDRTLGQRYVCCHPCDGYPETESGRTSRSRVRKQKPLKQRVHGVCGWQMLLLTCPQTCVSGSQRVLSASYLSPNDKRSGVRKHPATVKRDIGAMFSPYFISFERRSNEDDGSHGGDHIIGWDMLHLSREKFRSVPQSSRRCTVTHKSTSNQHKCPLPCPPPPPPWVVRLMDGEFQTPGSICLIDCLWMFLRQGSISHWKHSLLFLSLLPHIIKVSIIKPDAGVSRDLSCSNTDVTFHTFLSLVCISVWCESYYYRQLMHLKWKRTSDICSTFYIRRNVVIQMVTMRKF